MTWNYKLSASPMFSQHSEHSDELAFISKSCTNKLCDSLLRLICFWHHTYIVLNALSNERPNLFLSPLAWETIKRIICTGQPLMDSSQARWWSHVGICANCSTQGTRRRDISSARRKCFWKLLKSESTSLVLCVTSSYVRYCIELSDQDCSYQHVRQMVSEPAWKHGIIKLLSGLSYIIYLGLH